MSTHPKPFESMSMSTCSKSTILQFYYSAKVGLTCLSFTVSHLMWNALSYDAIHAFVAVCISDRNALSYDARI